MACHSASECSFPLNEVNFVKEWKSLHFRLLFIILIYSQQNPKSRGVFSFFKGVAQRSLHMRPCWKVGSFFCLLKNKKKKNNQSTTNLRIWIAVPIFFLFQADVCSKLPMWICFRLSPVNRSCPQVDDGELYVQTNTVYCRYSRSFCWKWRWMWVHWMLAKATWLEK